MKPNFLFTLIGLAMIMLVGLWERQVWGADLCYIAKVGLFIVMITSQILVINTVVEDLDL